MQLKRAVLLLEAGKEKVIFPGDRTCKVQVGRDAKVINLVKAPSGHLVISCDEYASVNASRRPSTTTFTVTSHGAVKDDDEPDVRSQATGHLPSPRASSNAGPIAGPPAGDCIIVHLVTRTENIDEMMKKSIALAARA